MTVEELINRLKKMPKKMEVHLSAHDNSLLESQGTVTDVFVRDWDAQRLKKPYGDDFGYTGKCVILKF